MVHEQFDGAASNRQVFKGDSAMCRLRTIGLLCVMTALLGCGETGRARGDLVPVAGTVTVDGEKVGHVLLTFFPKARHKATEDPVSPITRDIS